MLDAPVVIKRIRLDDLPAYAHTFVGPAPPPGVAPITRIRALSQAKNPHARPDDVALLTAYSGDKVIGYHGVLPGLLARDGRISRVHWSSAVFVADEFRGLGVGQKLISAFKSLGKDLVVPAGITPSAEGAYLSGKFLPLGKRSFFQLRVDRIDRFSRLLKPLTGVAAHAGRLIDSPAAWFGRQVYTLQKKRFYRRTTSGMRLAGPQGAWRRVDRINRFHPAPPKNRTLFFRGAETVNWMLAAPWVYSLDTVPRIDLSADVRHYYFTKTRKLFRYAAFELYAPTKKTCNGFVILSMSRARRRAQVKILDYTVADPQAARTACHLALVAAKTILADRIEIPVELATHFQRHPLTRPLLKYQDPLCLGCPGRKDSPLKKTPGRIDLRLFDGDAGFT